MTRHRKADDLDVVALRRRAESHVRPRREGVDPAECAVRRGMYTRRGECYSCGLLVRTGDHCHLLEACDRCGDADDPCGTTEAVSQQLKESV
jgi:hypothetical protein